MATTAGLPHRNLINARPTTNSTPGSPHTPARVISSTYGSPSSLRAEEDCIVIELGSRHLRVGLAGDCSPRGTLRFGPEQQRRAGDYRQWLPEYQSDWRRRSVGQWGEAYELYRPDLRDVDLGLVGSWMAAAIKDAYTNFLLIDSRPRRVTLALPPALPLPLLSTIFDTLFNSFQTPTVSLMSAPILSVVASGLRGGLVVDMGWAETVVTGVYEFREIQTHRTTRGGKLLSRNTLEMLAATAERVDSIQTGVTTQRETQAEDFISFEECEDVVFRASWCRAKEALQADPQSSRLSPLQEEDEEQREDEVAQQSIKVLADKEISIPLKSSRPPRVLKMPLSAFADTCDLTFFADGKDFRQLDDEEMPLHLLVYKSLMRLPVDVRSICMSRIIFTGGSSNILGLQERIVDEVAALVHHRGWDPVVGRAADEVRSKARGGGGSYQSSGGPQEVSPATKPSDNDGGLPNVADMSTASARQASDIDVKLRREANKAAPPPAQGVVRAASSLGPWSGASLLSQLKVPALSVVEREQWLQHGAAGASRPGEVNMAKIRQSLGPGGVRMAAGERSSWTLGPWG